MIINSEVEGGGALADIKSGAEITMKEVNDIGRSTVSGGENR